MHQVNSQAVSVGQQQESKREGLEFMATRFNIVDAMRYLRNERLVTPAEKAVLEEIMECTIFARNHKNTICAKAEIFIEELSELCGYKSANKIWPLLRSLHEKYLITSEPTLNKKSRILGLNEYFFGQILIDKQHEAAQRKAQNHLKVVPEQPTDHRMSTDRPSVTLTDKHTDHVEITHGACVENTQSVGSQHTERVLISPQPIDIIHEKSPLDSSRSYLDILDREKKLTFSVRDRDREPESSEDEKREAEAIKAKIRSLTSGLRKMPR